MSKVEQLRLDRRMSMEALAQLLDTTTSTVNRIEKGETRLISPWVEKLAAAFAVSPLEILSDELQLSLIGRPGDVEPYAPPDGAKMPGAMGGDLYRCRSNVLAEVGIKAGDILVVEPAPSDLLSGDVVIVRINGGPEAGLYLRQHLQPRLYVTNATSDADNCLPITHRSRNLQVLGIVASRYEVLRRPTNHSANGSRA